MEVTASDRDDVQRASLRLPNRQRAALELRESKGLSYEQIAETLGTSAGSVAQLIERARINLYDELRGTVLASVAAPSAECERALPLIAARQDGELAASSEDATWLATHLPGCDRCRLATEQMAEAAAFYRGEEAESAAVSAAAPATSPSGTAARSRWRHVRRHRIALASSLAGLVLGSIVVALVAGNGSSDPVPSTADAAARQDTTQAVSDAHLVRAAPDARTAEKHATKRGARAAVVATSQTGSGDSSSPPVYTPPEGADGDPQGSPPPGPHGSGGDTAVRPAEQKSTPPETKPKPPPGPTQASQPTALPVSEAAPPHAEESPPSAEEPTAEHGHKGEPPGQQKEPPGQAR